MAFHIDRFSALDDLPKKHWGDPLAVLAILNRVGRFSSFEVEGRLAGSIDHIIKSGWVTTSGEYPWCNITLTEAGRQALSEQKAPSP